MQSEKADRNHLGVQLGISILVIKENEYETRQISEGVPLDQASYRGK